MGCSSRRQVVVSGYCDAGHLTTTFRHTSPGDFFRIWLDNTRAISPYRIYVIAAGGSSPYARGVEFIEADNIGHAHAMPSGQQLGGWGASFSLGLLLAYHNRADLVYKEQDCLAFGPWLQRLYAEIGDRGAICGHINTNNGAKGMLAQSLVLVKFEFLLRFAAEFLAIEESCATLASEDKFVRVGERTGMLARSTMGYDRTRPVNYDDEAFYLQQITYDEMRELRNRGLVADGVR